MLSEARKIRIALALVGLEIAFLLIYLSFMAGMDARCVRDLGCTPAELAQQIKGGGHAE